MNMRERILSTATNLFEFRGIHASGVDTIAAETRISKAPLYKYFPSKNLLIAACLRDKSDRFYEWLNSRLSSKNANSLEILIELCELVEQLIMTPEFHGLPFHIASVEFPDPTHPINQYSAVLALELQGYFSKIAAGTGAKDPEALGQQLMILFEGAALVERLSPGIGAAKRAKNAAVTLIRASI
jgi:AcrR family transcriptional regulator